MSMVKTHRLRILRELGDRGSLNAAAEALNVTPSAASQQLNALQAQSRVPLTERRNGRLVLTAAGRSLAAAGVDIERAQARADNALEQFLDSDLRPVSVSGFHSAGVALFAKLLREVQASNLQITLSDRDVAQNEFPRITGDHDLVIAHRLPHQPPWPTDRVTAMSLYIEPLEIAIRPGHPLAAKDELSPRDIASYRWVTVHRGFPLRGVVEQITAVSGVPARIAHAVNEFSVAASIVSASDTIAIMPRTVTSTLPPGLITLRPLVGAGALRRYVDVLARPENLERASVRRVLAHLQHIAGQASCDATALD